MQRQCGLWELKSFRGRWYPWEPGPPLGWGESGRERSSVPGQEVLGFNESDNNCFITVRALLIERTCFFPLLLIFLIKAEKEAYVLVESRPILFSHSFVRAAGRARHKMQPQGRGLCPELYPRLPERPWTNREGRDARFVSVSMTESTASSPASKYSANIRQVIQRPRCFCWCDEQVQTLFSFKQWASFFASGLWSEIILSSP